MNKLTLACLFLAVQCLPQAAFAQYHISDQPSAAETADWRRQPRTFTALRPSATESLPNHSYFSTYEPPTMEEQVSIGADLAWLWPASARFRSALQDSSSGQSESLVLKHSLRLGPRIRIGLPLTDSTQLVTTYQGVDGWDERGSLSTDVAAGTLSTTARYRAGLHTLESNIHLNQFSPYLSPLLGFRYFDYRDRFGETFELESNVLPDATESTSGRALNRMTGGQLGLAFRSSPQALAIRGSAKLGILSNNTLQDGPIYSGALLIDGTPEARAEDRQSLLTLLGDFEVGCSYQLRSNFMIHWGYQGLLLDNMIQSAHRDGSPAAGASMSFHGGTFGFDWAF